ncbi:FAD-dependent 5-carboxymethylaminomethyl-2-thiouridine(34) oxidoreductase MnmC [Candidatus Puniceispirillum sp.]|nr:FAD-dependent 5-carboxymethylaminomethyl-2-thiouridine(34) oxidoreductase MnmC [Candidatus Puniceispirillum sp.]
MSNSISHQSTDYRLAAAKVSNHDGVLWSDDFNDRYFSSESGLGETEHVFIDGNHIRERLPNTGQFTIAETGFGTGLNFLAVMELLEKKLKKNHGFSCQVDYISLESRPLSAEIITKVHQLFPSVENQSRALLAALPPRWPGLHRRTFFSGQLRLHLIYGDANDALLNADFLVDAWFLDGFSPAKNPELWSSDVLSSVGRLTRAGGSFATFTSASAVRQKLAEAGFFVKKYSGFGRKREMLAGQKLKINVSRSKSLLCKKSIGIIGGGIAGASVAAGLFSRGAHPHIIDAHECLANAASGNQLALQSPRLSVDNNIASRMSADCLSFAAHLSDLAKAVISNKVISLDWPEREALRQGKFRKQLWPIDLMQFVDASVASSYAGIVLPIGGVVYHYGRVIDPAKLTHYLAKDSLKTFNFKVVEINRDDEGFQVLSADGRSLSFDQLVFAGGADLEALNQLLSVKGIAVDITSGQVSHVPATNDLAGLKVGLSYGGYLTPAKDGYHELGATFDRNVRIDVLDSGHRHNRDLLPAGLLHLLPNPDVFGARVSRRASTPDRNPVCGKIDDDLYAIGALGARGLTLAPLLGDMLAAQMLGMPVTLGLDIQQCLEPFRFRLRANRI